MAWWIWLLVGLGLLAFEMLTPGGFFVLFFGLSALLVGVAVLLDLAGPDWFQWLLFSALSITSVLFLRGRVLAWFQSHQGSTVGIETLVGEVAIVRDDVAPGSVGKAELRGTAWSVRSRDATPLHRGQRCRVNSVDGLTLWVTAEPDRQEVAQ